jgi:hypothetical protein
MTTFFRTQRERPLDRRRVRVDVRVVAIALAMSVYTLAHVCMRCAAGRREWRAPAGYRPRPQGGSDVSSVSKMRGGQSQDRGEGGIGTFVSKTLVILRVFEGERWANTRGRVQ